MLLDDVNSATVQKPCPRGSIVACNFPNLPDHESFLGEEMVLIKNTGSRSTESDTPGLRPGNSHFKQLFWVNLMIKQVWENSRQTELSF